MFVSLPLFCLRYSATGVQTEELRVKHVFIHQPSGWLTACGRSGFMKQSTCCLVTKHKPLVLRYQTQTSRCTTAACGASGVVNSLALFKTQVR